MLGMRHIGGGHVKTEGNKGHGTLRVTSGKQTPERGMGHVLPQGLQKEPILLTVSNFRIPEL